MGGEYNEGLAKRRRLGLDNTASHHATNEDSPNDDMTKKYGIGAKLLSKMGYKQGQGLGKNGAGIAEPIEPEKRPISNAGIGSMSNVMDHEDESESDSSSSDDDLLQSWDAEALKSVDFQKQSSTMTSENDTQLEMLASDLEILCNIGLPTKIEKLNMAEKEEFGKFGQDLLGVQEQLKAVEHRISFLKPEISVSVAKEESLKKITETNVEDFELKNDLILGFGEPELVDKLYAGFLQSTFKNFWSTWDPLDPKNEVLKKLKHVINNVEFYIGFSDKNYTQTQTVIYRNVIQKLVLFWQDFDLTKEKINLIVNLSLDYQPILRSLNCERFLLEKYIVPKLIDAFEKWDLSKTHDDQLSPASWFRDIFYLIEESNRSILSRFKDILESKLCDYCDEWHHRRSSVIRNSDLNFIQELLGQENFSTIIRTRFLSKFIEQLWDKYFDLVVELEEPSTDDTSLYFYQKLQEYRLYFHVDDYTILVNAFFNELNKILYQWLLYADTQDLPGARWWFNKLINQIFSYNEPIEVEIKEIRRSLAFFQDPDALLHPIHKDKLDLRAELNFADDINKYDIQNIPLRKVVPTFKEVVEDYCEQNGFVMQKTDIYTQLPQEIDRNALAPVFKVHIGNKVQNIAIKDDVLWIKRGEGPFIPVYLYELGP